MRKPRFLGLQFNKLRFERIKLIIVMNKEMIDKALGRRLSEHALVQYAPSSTESAPCAVP